MRREARASLTPVVTLLFLCIFSLFLAVYQLSVSHYVTASGQRYLNTALQTAFSYYDRDLWREYRILFCPMRQRQGEYLSVMEDSIQKGRMPYELKAVEGFDLVFATDQEYEPVRKQILAWSKYEMGEDLLNKVKERFGLLEEAKEEESKAKEEVKEAEEKIVICRKLLTLYTLVEGIRTNDSGVVIGGQGIPEKVRYFAKMLCPDGDITASSMGIPRTSIWQALCASYYDPLYRVGQWEEDIPDVNQRQLEDWIFQLESVRSKTEEAIAVANELKEQEASFSESEREFCNVTVMSEKLTINKKILDHVLTISREPLTQTSLRQIRNQFHQYQTRALMFGYDGFVEEERKKNPFGGLNLSLNDKFMDWFVEDSEKLSKGELESAGKYEELLVRGTDEQEAEESLEDTASVVKQAGRTRGGSKSIGKSLDDSGGITGFLHKGVEWLKERFLINYYIDQHFSHYSMECNVDSSETELLQYEKEYLAAGKGKDQENLSVVCTRLLLIRMGFNFASILTDSSRKAEALAIATGMVGFTFLQPLVTVVKYALLVGWSLEESFLDVAALLQGYYVPLMKNKDTFHVTVDELVDFSPKSVQRRASQYDKRRKNLQYFSYEEYLDLLLCGVGQTTIIARVMDLIESRMKHSFQQHFTFMECLYQASARALYKWDRYTFESTATFSYGTE